MGWRGGGTRLREPHRGAATVDSPSGRRGAPSRAPAPRQRPAAGPPPTSWAARERCPRPTCSEGGQGAHERGSCQGARAGTELRPKAKSWDGTRSRNHPSKRREQNPISRCREQTLQPGVRAPSTTRGSRAFFFLWCLLRSAAADTALAPLPVGAAGGGMGGSRPRCRSWSSGPRCRGGLARRGDALLDALGRRPLGLRADVPVRGPPAEPPAPLAARRFAGARCADRLTRRIR